MSRDLSGRRRSAKLGLASIGESTKSEKTKELEKETNEMAERLASLKSALKSEKETRSAARNGSGSIWSKGGVDGALSGVGSRRGVAVASASSSSAKPSTTTVN